MRKVRKAKSQVSGFGPFGFYRRANETINQGLSLGSRIVLGVVSGVFGVGMLLIAPPTGKAVYIYLIGAFYLSISIACFTKGRIRQFVGSLIGTAVFLVGLAYLVSEVSGGLFWSSHRSEPSVNNALLFLFFFGIPGATYAYKARFGFHKEEEKESDPDV